jgi:Aspartyl/Asparaginyl beta-hydroxylase
MHFLKAAIRREFTPANSMAKTSGEICAGVACGNGVPRPGLESPACMHHPNENAQGSGYLKLPLRFNVPRLREDLRTADEFAWVAHFNANAYDEGWSCLPLRSVGGQLGHVIPIDGLPYQDTEIMARCPYFQEVLAQLPCTVTSVRLMALEPGAQILPHRDKKTSLEDGITRLHLPIQTTPEVLFCIDGEEVHFSPETFGI